jgi:hypothetical protein
LEQPADAGPAEPNPYRPAVTRWACPWLAGPVELHWHYHWWPDGTHSELGRGKPGRPADWLVAEAVAAYCARVTGKLPQPAPGGGSA